MSNQFAQPSKYSSQRYMTSEGASYHHRIPEKLVFLLSLRGLEYGGHLDNWYVYDIHECRELYHRARIIPNRVEIGSRTTTTQIIRAHYPDDYVVTTDHAYFYLRDRKIDFGNVHLTQSVDSITGSHIYRLMDCGARYSQPEIATIAMSQILHLHYNDSESIVDEIRRDMFYAYREELRRGL